MLGSKKSVLEDGGQAVYLIKDGRFIFIFEDRREEINKAVM